MVCLFSVVYLNSGPSNTFSSIHLHHKICCYVIIKEGIMELYSAWINPSPTLIMKKLDYRVGLTI